ncbi:MAG: hypothetical protein R3F34_12610 [Planctomycetota bacterium]
MFERKHVAGLAAFTLVALPLADLSRRAEEGETRERTITSTRTMAVTDSVMRIDGEEREMGARGGGSTTRTFSAEMTDVFQKVADGRATRFTRTFGDIASKSEREGGAQGGGQGGQGGGGRGRGFGGPRNLVSKLTGEDVIFTLDADSGEYVAAFPEESSADKDLLEGLVADVECAAFLPSSSVEVGAEWDVPLDVFAFVAMPAGNLHLAPEESGDDGEGRGGNRRGGFRGFGRPDNSDATMPYEFSGKFKATLAEYVEVDGARFARIELAFDVTGERDLAKDAEPVTRETPDGGEITMTTIELLETHKVEGKGELMWDVGHGRLSSLTLEGDVEESVSSATEMESDEGTRSFENETISEGTLAFEYHVK